MNTSDLLKQQGFVVLPQVLNSDEVKKARELMTEIFSTKSPYEGDLFRPSDQGGSVYMDIFNRYPQLRFILFSQKLRDGLASALGEDFLFLPDSGMHDSQYGSWHKDTTSQEKRGHKWQYEPDFQVVTCAIYLQDNSYEYGGGLDIVPDSHKETADRFAIKENPSLAERIVNKLKGGIKDPGEGLENVKQTLMTKAGDAVVFNLRLTHRATQPMVRPVPLEHRKFSIFQICSANNKHATNFVNYIKSRSEYIYLKDHNYDAALLSKAKEAKVHLTNFSSG